LLQAVKPPLQLFLQIPLPLHACPVGQTLSQAPQLLLSMRRFEQ
jgi:hypothetical protein